MMKRFLFLVLFLVSGCQSGRVPKDFIYQEIKTRDFKLYSLQKITDPFGVYKIYIEGDGNAFDAFGRPTNDPTPKGTFLRELAFQDPSPNVIYLARPCQYIKAGICEQRHWTSARFSFEAVKALNEAVFQIAAKEEVILIGFSGGAQMAGLIASAYNNLRVKKIITIAGNLDHEAWTDYHGLPRLDQSMNLEAYQERFFKINQTHFAGSDDEIMPAELIKAFVKDRALVIVIEGATHHHGWETAYPLIFNEN